MKSETISIKACKKCKHAHDENGCQQITEASSAAAVAFAVAAAVAFAVAAAVAFAVAAAVAFALAFAVAFALAAVVAFAVAAHAALAAVIVERCSCQEVFEHKHKFKCQEIKTRGDK